MRSKVWTVSCSAIALAVVSCVTAALFAEPPRESPAASETEEKSDAAEKSEDEKSEDEKRVSVEVARERAKLAHNIYSATLDVIHHRYFRDDRSSVPARSMEDVFSVIARQENIKARWIAVNTKAMSIDHRPQDEFEKQAAKVLAKGKPAFELVENGVYRRAGSISLMNRGCLGCHLGFGASGRIDRFAGLVISIPVITD